MSWRECAILCNWLCNDGGTSRSAFLNGAYDVSTFGYDANDVFTDQLTHHPGARFYIPNWNEQMKAMHYDPNKNGPGVGGYWEYGHSSDTPPIYGPPGSGQANAVFRSPSPFGIPLGAYADQLSPWGLLDANGGTGELSESVRTLTTGMRYRIWLGSGWTDGSASLSDSARNTAGAQYPSQFNLYVGFRVASSVPAPGPCALSVGVFALLCARRKR